MPRMPPTRDSFRVHKGLSADALVPEDLGLGLIHVSLFNDLSGHSSSGRSDHFIALSFETILTAEERADAVGPSLDHVEVVLSDLAAVARHGPPVLDDEHVLARDGAESLAFAVVIDHDLVAL